MHLIHAFPLAFFLNAVAVTAASTADSPASDIQWVNCSQNVPSTLDTTTDLTNLPSTLLCGEMVVPMDYSQPISEENNITLGLSMYRPLTATKGVLFLYVQNLDITLQAYTKRLSDSNPGGSDAGAVIPWEVALNLTDGFVGLEEFDLMGTVLASTTLALANQKSKAMDVRGTYSSNVLNVSLATFDGILGP